MSNTDMYLSKFSVRSLGATANLIKNTQKFFFSKLWKGCSLAKTFKANESVVVECLHVTALT